MGLERRNRERERYTVALGVSRYGHQGHLFMHLAGQGCQRTVSFFFSSYLDRPLQLKLEMYDIYTFILTPVSTSALLHKPRFKQAISF